MISTLIILLSYSGTPLYEQTPEQVNTYLQEMQADNLSFEQRLRRVVRDSIGTEYNGGPLGEGGGGAYDADPLVDLKRVDCVTFVEQSVALSVTPNFDDMLTRLQGFRYKNGKINYEDRNHFMISDWIKNNPYCKDVTGELGVSIQTLERTISKKDFFQLVKAPNLGQDTPDQQVKLPIVPTALTKEAEAKLPDTALIVFVGKVDWLFALHCGLYLRDEEGQGYLAHASSKAESVTKTRLTDYMKSQENRYLGFAAYELTEPESIK
jgi:hypothetical protein